MHRIPEDFHTIIYIICYYSYNLIFLTYFIQKSNLIENTKIAMSINDELTISFLIISVQKKSDVIMIVCLWLKTEKLSLCTHISYYSCENTPAI